MQGVRIRLEEYPFVKYNFRQGEYYFKNDVETYIDYAKLYDEDKTTIAANQPQLFKVEYTDDENLIYPTIRSVKNNFERQGNIVVNRQQSKTYSFDKLGKYKRKEWSFQNEVRYIINMSLWSMKELENCQSVEQQYNLVNRLEDEKYKAPYDLFFLKLREDALLNMEIMLGPKVTESQKEIVHLIVKKYCPNAEIITSNLKIK